MTVASSSCGCGSRMVGVDASSVGGVVVVPAVAAGAAGHQPPSSRRVSEFASALPRAQLLRRVHRARRRAFAPPRLATAVGVHEEHHGALLRRQRVERREQFGFHVGHLVGDRPPELRGHRRCGEASYRTLPDPVQKLRFSAGRYTSCMARRFPTALATWEMWDRLDVTTASLRRSAPSATATSTVSTSPLRAIMSPT